MIEIRISSCDAGGIFSDKMTMVTVVMMGMMPLIVSI